MASPATATAAISAAAAPSDGAKTDAAAAADAADKHKRFENEGVIFKAKLIGSELVMEPRGDKMCQNSIQRLKAIIKGTNSHKRRVVLKISYQGVKVYDEKSNEMLHHHEVSQISYIASDDTDNRTFGYVSDVPNKAHQFICFKTGGPAISVMSVISALFEAVLEKKNQAEKEKLAQVGGGAGKQQTSVDSSTQQDSIDLIGDSGIVEGEGSIDEPNQDLPQQQQQQLRQPQMKSSSSAALEGLVISPNNSFSYQQQQQQQQQHQQQQQQMAAVHQRGQQSASAADLIFDDLFAGLSDPIIVDRNESLVSYKQPATGGGGNRALVDNAFGGSFADSGSSAGALGLSSASQSQRQQPQQPHHQQLPPPQQVPPRTGGGGLGGQFPMGQRRQSGQQKQQMMLPPPSSLPRPAPMMGHNNSSSNMGGAGGPHGQNRSLVYNHSSVSLSDAALTRQSSFTSPANNQQQQLLQQQQHNTSSDSYVDRYAVFNDIDNLPSIFESASLGSSMNKLNQQQQQLHHQHHHLQQQQQHQQHQQQHQQQQQHQFQFHQGGHSVGTLGSTMQTMSAMNAMNNNNSNSNININNNNNMFRQRNPFDDDFFA